ncbi:hypothetical protein K503DRAFT_143135 [Rhizopogon vinicolor AM-OR11-026]|uniref:Uncharacterized protein n=1 Tax=Rhizopogon vinicolor AM-OR11-026 TaxID=1314800 RepID=A0A1B7N1H7_9AGAM|nr:hypothetical protein K503DRAFT_143135 [Rhizopogon vinicolor AM-OR11-026]
MWTKHFITHSSIFHLILTVVFHKISYAKNDRISKIALSPTQNGTTSMMVPRAHAPTNNLGHPCINSMLAFHIFSICYRQRNNFIHSNTLWLRHQFERRTRRTWCTNILGFFVHGMLPVFGFRSKINGDVSACTQLTPLIASSILLRIGAWTDVSLCALRHLEYRDQNNYTSLGRLPETTDQRGPITNNPSAEDVSGILIIRIRENLDFAHDADERMPP